MGDYYINYNLTEEYPVPVDDTTYRYFLTPIHTTAMALDTIGYLVGHVLNDDVSVLNVTGIQGQPDANGVTTVYMSVLDGAHLGQYFVDATNTFLDFEVDGTPTGDNHVIEQRSWFACTMDCVGDANYACAQNGRCAVLKWVSNIIGKGAGEFSIIAGCMGACTKTRNALDLLPNH